MRSVGLDLGKKEIAYCEVQHGKVVGRRTARGLDELEDVLGPQSPPATVAIEACREAWHVHDMLTKHGHKVLLIDTTRVKQLGVGHHGRKRDSIDAEVIAFAVDRRQIPEAHLLSPHRRQLREKIHARRALVETRATYTTMMRGIVRARGEKLPTCDTEHFRANLKRATLTAEARSAIAPLIAVLETIDVQLSNVETELEQLAAKEPTIARLTSTPGVDLVVASVFVSVIDEAKRFPDAHKVASYLGLVPREDTTGGRDKQRLGSITKCGNPHARAMLVQAAWCLFRGRGSDPLRAWARGIDKRRGKRIAVIALARRLAGVLWAMWRDGQPYDPSRVATASARGLKTAACTTEAAAVAMRTIAMKAARRKNRVAARVKTDPAKLKPTAAATATKEVAR
jgi:transposase